MARNMMVLQGGKRELRFKMIMGGIFLVALVIQVFGQIQKYFEGFITQTSYPREDVDAKLPSVSICPGFKIEALPPDKTDIHVYTEFFSVYPWPEEETTEAKIREWWANSTVSFYDVVQFAKYTDYSFTKTIANFTPNEINEYGEVAVRHSLNGLCYTFNFKTKITKDLWFWMLLDLGNAHKMPMHIHAPNAELGLNYQLWILPAYSLFIERGLLFYDLRLSRVALNQKNTEEKPCDTISEYDLFTCVRDFNAATYVNQTEIDKAEGCQGMKACWIPQADIFINHLNLPACLTAKEEKCMLANFWNILPTQPLLATNGCPRKCFEESWSVRLVGETPYVIKPGAPSNQTEVFISFSGTFLEIKEEILLFDFNAILSAVGGSMGLFLGFSCLDCASFFFRKSAQGYDHCKAKQKANNVEDNLEKKNMPKEVHNIEKKFSAEYGIHNYAIKPGELALDQSFKSQNYDPYKYGRSSSRSGRRTAMSARQIAINVDNLPRVH